MSKKLSITAQFKPLALCCVLLALSACGANTNESASNAAAGAPAKAETASSAAQPAPSATVMTAFTLASGSSGNGAAMRELRSINGTLREPDSKFDVYDTDSKVDLKTLTQNIQASLDRGRQVLIDSDGTPESRSRAAQISYEAIGAALPDTGSVVIRKVPEERGGGYGVIPVYSQAEVAQQIAQGQISKPEQASNSVVNFFFETPAGAR